MVDSVIWTDSEAKYLKAMLAWDPLKGDAKRRSKPREKKPIKGEFGILVVGGKGTGKSSIMQRFCKNTFPSSPDPIYERGGRHTIEIDDAVYRIDALEMASKHISSDAFLSQALAITEAAVLVYDVTSPDSFRLAQGVYDFLRDNKGSREYGVLLVGNKSDVDDEERMVSWAEGRKAAMGFGSLLQGAAGSGGSGPTGVNGPTSPRFAADGMAVGMGMGGVMGRVNGVDGDTGRMIREKRSMSVSVASGGRRGIVSRGSRRTASSRGGSVVQQHHQQYQQSVSVNINGMVVREGMEHMGGRGGGGAPNEPTTQVIERVRVDSPHDYEEEEEEGGGERLVKTQTREIRQQRSTESTTNNNNTNNNNAPAQPGHAPPPPPLTLPHSNGSTASSTLHAQSYAYASSQAIPSPRPATVSFLECSAKSGDNVRAIFEHTGREVLRLRKINQERKDEAERANRERLERLAGGSPRAKKGSGGAGGGGGGGGGGIWKTLTTPWFKRQGGLGVGQ